MIFLSFDQDWAPAWATRELVARLRASGQRGTLFVTNACPSLVEGARDGTLELGIHPNFLPGSSHGADTAAVLDTMAALVPDARGVRAHCLYAHTPLRMEYRRRGLTYESSDLMDGVTGLRPMPLWNGLVRLPIFWEDDVHLAFGRRCTLDQIDLDAPGLKVMNLHPVLLALNSADLDGYAALKAELARRGVALTAATPEDFAPFEERTRRGVRDLLDALLERMRARPATAGGVLAAAAEL